MTPYDSVKNLVKVTASIGYDASAQTIALSSGDGDSLPVAPFNMTWWNSTDYFDPADDPNVEIVRVTGVSGDSIVVLRAQESTSASTKNTADKTYTLLLGLTALTLSTFAANILETQNNLDQLQIAFGKLVEYLVQQELEVPDEALQYAT